MSEEELYQDKLRHLAYYVANHPRPKAFAAKLAKRHGQALVDKLREILATEVKHETSHSAY